MAPVSLWAWEMLVGRRPVAVLVPVRSAKRRPAPRDRSTGHPALQLCDVTELRGCDEDALTPRALSLLAASAPRAGSGGGRVTRKGYPANPATSPGTPASPEAVASPL